MLAALLCVSWMVGLVASTSMHAVPHNSTRSHDHGLRDAMAKVSSLGESDNRMLNELKEILLFLSQKIDDSDARIESLEDEVRAQDATIKSLKTEVGDATSFHRYLQSDDSDCLPQFRNTAFGPRCDFRHVTRFQNRTFFNDDVVFNENVEFDTDANCMPTFNSTTRMCNLNNNFTFDEGDVIFDYNVRFDEDVRFNDDVRFRDLVRMESDVQFNNGGEVTFNKDTKFHENVLIKNSDHDIEFKLEDKVTARFYQDPTFKIDTHTTFYQNANMEKNLQIDGTLKVEQLTELDDLELFGYLWVDKETRLDGELKANHRAKIKGGLTVQTGGLKVDREGADITGTTHVSGTFNLNGQGNANGNFDVDGKLTANTAVIDNTPNRRELQTFLHEIPVPAPVGPVLKVIGDADVQGKLEADRIRSDDINFENIDMNQIISEVRIDLQGGDLTVGDIEIVNNFGPNERVLTESRMIQMMNGMDLTVDSITANRATINSKSVPTDPMSSADVVRLLNDQNLNLASVTTDTAVIGGSVYQPSQSDSLTADDILNMLRGENLRVNSIDTQTATIGGEMYTPPSDGLDILDVVDQLGSYEGRVTIPKFGSYEIDVIDDPRRDQSGQPVNPNPASIEINGEEVATKRETVRLSNRIDSINDDAASSQQPEVSTMSVLQALEGASLSVYSLDTTAISMSGTDVATVDDVSFMIGDVQARVDGAENTCTCSANDVEAVVTTEFVQDKVDESYIKTMGFVTDGDLSTYDLGGDCTCGASDVQAHVDQPFLEGLGVSVGPSECSCSAEFVEEVISAAYIQDAVDDLGVAYGDVEATCTCSSEQIESVVTYDYIAGKGFMDEAPECSCAIEDSQITGVVDEAYIGGLGFLTTCPCGDSVTTDEDGR